MTKRALITGISGFTGSYLAKELKNCGYEVFGSSTKPSSSEHILQLDISDLASVRKLVNLSKPDLVVHMAAVSHVEFGNIANLYITNIVGSRNLLQALSECKHFPEAIMLVSSGNVYGNLNCDSISELDLPRPSNDYSVTKIAMENIGLMWASKLPVFIVRPFNYTGHGQSSRFLIPKIIDHYVNKSKSISLGNLDVYREFNDVRQIVYIYLQLLLNKPIGKVINVCSGQVYSLSDVISLMQDLTSYELKVIVDSSFIRTNEIKILRGSNELLQSIIGNFVPNSLLETLAWMYESKIKYSLI